MRFLFNESGIKILTYPEVEFGKDSKALLKTHLFNYEGKIHNKEMFSNLFESIVWVSYRRGFPPLLKSSPVKNGGNYYDPSSKKFTSDCGWGCMIRCA